MASVDSSETESMGEIDVGSESESVDGRVLDRERKASLRRRVIFWRLSRKFPRSASLSSAVGVESSEASRDS